MAFEPTGLLPRTREKEYASYVGALGDVLSVLSEFDNAHDVHEKVMNLIVEAADAIGN